MERFGSKVIISILDKICVEMVVLVELTIIQAWESFGFCELQFTLLRGTELKEKEVRQD